MRLVIFAVLGVVSACSSDAASPEGIADVSAADTLMADARGGASDGDAADAHASDPPDSAPTDPDFDCHYDCLAYQAECFHGVIQIWSPTPVPCAFWTGECPSRFEVCPTGDVCGVASSNEWAEEPIALMCTPAVALGGACTFDTECLEPPSVRREDGTVGVTYYGCSDAGVCAEEEAPSPPDYMAPCAPTFELPPSWPSYGQTSDTCSGGVCLIARREEEGCVGRGCTLRCKEDQDCPQGSLCVHRDDLGLVYSSAEPDLQVCVPAGVLTGVGGPRCPEPENAGD